MRILLVHNHYGSTAPSGENEVVRLEHALLCDRRHDVRMLARHSDVLLRRGLLGAVQGALSVPWNPIEARRLAQEVERFRPDVVHVHNTFPMLSPAIFSAASGAGARVLTLHNYRLLCAAAIPMREGKTCTECIEDRTVLPAMRHGCYRHSRLATLPLAASIALHRARGTWQHDVEAFIALTGFQRSLMVAGGLPADRIEVKPNFYPGQPVPVPWAQRDPVCVFAGRLSPEKGIVKLIDAWVSWGESAPELKVVGDGPLRTLLEEKARGARVRFLGLRTAEQAQEAIAQARLVILPSECLEGFPMTVREAFAFGTPVAVSDLGSLPSLVVQGRCGILLHPFETGAMLQVLRAAWQDQAGLEVLGRAGHEEFLKRYTADANYTLLLDIYQRAVARRRRTA